MIGEWSASSPADGGEQRRRPIPGCRTARDVTGQDRMIVIAPIECPIRTTGPAPTTSSRTWYRSSASWGSRQRSARLSGLTCHGNAVVEHLRDLAAEVQRAGSASSPGSAHSHGHTTSVRSSIGALIDFGVQHDAVRRGDIGPSDRSEKKPPGRLRRCADPLGDDPAFQLHPQRDPAGRQRGDAA